MNSAGDYEKFIRAVGQTLQEKRLSLGWTQTELAKRCGRTQSVIAKIENGPLPNVGMKVLYEIAEALSLPVQELIEASSVEVNKKNSSSSQFVVRNLQKGLDLLPVKKRKQLENIFNELIRYSVD